MGRDAFQFVDMLIEEGLLRQAEADSYNWGTRRDDVEYELIYENRFKILKSAFQRFNIEDEAFKRFCRANKEWLADYSLYMAIKNEMGGRDWLAGDEGFAVCFRRRYSQ